MASGFSSSAGSCADKGKGLELWAITLINAAQHRLTYMTNCVLSTRPHAGVALESSAGVFTRHRRAVYQIWSGTPHQDEVAALSILSQRHSNGFYVRLGLVIIKHNVEVLDSLKCRIDMSDLSGSGVCGFAVQRMVPFHDQSTSNHDSFILHSLVPRSRAYYLSLRPVPRCFPTSATVSVEHHSFSIQ